jgi:hypothetical protein
MLHEWDSPAIHLPLRQAVHSLLHQSAPTAGSVWVAVLISLGAFVLLQVGLHKLERVLARDHVDAADAVAVRDAVDLVRFMYDLQRHSAPLSTHVCKHRSAVFNNTVHLISAKERPVRVGTASGTQEVPYEARCTLSTVIVLELKASCGMDG